MNKLIGGTGEATYWKDSVDDESNKTRQVCSTYQRNEIAQFWEREDGSVFVTVRFKTADEATETRMEDKGALDKAIAEGRAIRDRVGRVKWKKH